MLLRAFERASHYNLPVHSAEHNSDEATKQQKRPPSCPDGRSAGAARRQRFASLRITRPRSAPRLRYRPRASLHPVLLSNFTSGSFPERRPTELRTSGQLSAGDGAPPNRWINLSSKSRRKPSRCCCCPVPGALASTETPSTPTLLAPVTSPSISMLSASPLVSHTDRVFRREELAPRNPGPAMPPSGFGLPRLLRRNKPSNFRMATL